MAKGNPAPHDPAFRHGQNLSLVACCILSVLILPAEGNLAPAAQTWSTRAADTSFSVSLGPQCFGCLQDLSHRPTDIHFAVGLVPLFELSLTRPTGWIGAHKLNSSTFRRAVVVASSADRLELAFSDPPGAFGQPLRLTANATIFIGHGDDLIHFKLRIGNGGPWAVQSALYPGLQQPAFLDQNKSLVDYLLWPCFEGVVLPSPGAHVRLNRQGKYPNGCPVQVGARYLDHGGLYIAAHDGSGQVKSWNLQNKLHTSVRLDLVHYHTERVGENFTIPYDTVIGTFGSGGWRSAADKYKMWAKQQSWCATKLTDRKDIPSVLLAGAPGIIRSIAGQNGYSAGSLLGPYLEKLPEFIASYKRKINTSRMIIVPYGWEVRYQHYPNAAMLRNAHLAKVC